MALRDWFRGNKPPTTRVVMNVSTATPEFDLVAGEKYNLPVELADVFIAKGYAHGETSRDIPAEEIADLTRLDQRMDL